MEQGTDLATLREDIDEVMDEYYHILSKNIPEEKAIPLLQQFKLASIIEKEIAELENKQQGESETIEALAEAQTNIQELKAVIAKHKIQAVNSIAAKKNYEVLYLLFYRSTCQIKKATLLLKSQKLSEKQYEKLMDVQKKFSELKNEKMMRKALQMKNENQDEDYILNQIDKQMDEELEEIQKEKTNFIDQEIRVNAEYTIAKEKYEQELRQKNERKRKELLEPPKKKYQEERLTKMIFSKTINEEEDPERRPMNGLIPTKITQAPSPYEKIHQILIIILSFFTIALVIKGVMSFKNSTNEVV